MSRVRTVFLPTAIVAAVVVIAVYVFRDDPPAAWLRVDAPAAIVVGQAFVATVTLAEPRDGLFLDLDLHGRDARKHPLRAVATGSSQTVTAKSHRYTFSLTVPDRADLAEAHAIIYLSTTGRWADRVQVARSTSLRVVRDVSGETDTRVAPLSVHDQQPDPVIHVANPPVMRGVIAVLWTAGAWLALGAWRRRAIPRGVPVLAAICLGLALWEAFALGGLIEATARSLARTADVYEDRRSFQQIATVTTLCALGALAIIGLRRSRRRLSAPTLAGLVTYGAVEFAGMLSLHEIDSLLAAAWGPLSVAVAIRIAAATLALAGIVRRSRGAVRASAAEFAR